MVVVVGGKNIISFGAGYGLIPMVAIYGYIKAFSIVSRMPAKSAQSKHTNESQLIGIYVGIFALGIPVYFIESRVSKPYLSLSYDP